MTHVTANLMRYNGRIHIFLQLTKHINQPACDVTGLAFMRHSVFLFATNEKRRAAIINYLDHKATDVDNWEISMSPSHYERQFFWTLSSVHISSPAPGRKAAK